MERQDGKHVCGNGERHDGGGLGMGAWLREGAGPWRGMGRVSGWGLHGGQGFVLVGGTCGGRSLWMRKCFERGRGLCREAGPRMGRQMGVASEWGGAEMVGGRGLEGRHCWGGRGLWMGGALIGRLCDGGAGLMDGVGLWEAGPWRGGACGWGGACGRCLAIGQVAIEGAGLV